MLSINEPSHKTQQRASTPALGLDWDRLTHHRRLVLASEALKDQPLEPYLLLPEVTKLLDACDDDITRLLINTLWQTGGRIEEVLSLTRDHLKREGETVYIFFRTLKQRARVDKDKRILEDRVVPTVNPAYIRDVWRYVVTHNITKHKPLFDFVQRTARRRLARVVEKAGLDLPFEVTPRTLRRSFAVHLIYHRVPLNVLQQYMGHRSLDSTKIYTRVLTAETASFLHGIPWSLSHE